MSDKFIRNTCLNGGLPAHFRPKIYVWSVTRLYGRESYLPNSHLTFPLRCTKPNFNWAHGYWVKRWHLPGFIAAARCDPSTWVVAMELWNFWEVWLTWGKFYLPFFFFLPPDACNEVMMAGAPTSILEHTDDGMEVGVESCSVKDSAWRSLSPEQCDSVRLTCLAMVFLGPITHTWILSEVIKCSRHNFALTLTYR